MRHRWEKAGDRFGESAAMTAGMARDRSIAADASTSNARTRHQSTAAPRQAGYTA
jgi:hypothetical protein